MIGDRNPSIVCGVFCKPNLYNDMIKHIDGKFGMTVREFRLIDIGMPLNENYNNAVNHLKHFANPQLKKILNFDFMNVKKIILGKVNLKEMKYEDWQTDNRHKLLLTGLTPLFLDDKYKDGDYYGEPCYTEEEKKNCEKLLKFESEGYEPKITGVFDE